VLRGGLRLLARVGVLRLMIKCQRLVNLFVTNLRGPVAPMTVACAPVIEVVPLSPTQSNVGMAFAAVSAAGRLTLSAVMDPDIVPEREVVTAAMREELAAVSAAAADLQAHGDRDRGHSSTAVITTLPRVRPSRRCSRAGAA
jgi:hypothetical protein